MRRLVRKKRLKFSIITAIIIVASFCAYYFYHREQAQALANFKPGNIMSDYVMSNYTTMTEAQIQAFLKSKNHCNDRDINKAKRYPNIRYNIRDGHFVCMADDLFDGESAAHIIWQASQDYHINPQVLLVLLEKEQSLVTDTWPNHIQYRTATGFGCPDTAPCDAQYYGLKNQVRLAAKLFRSVLDGGWSNYPVGNNFIQYNPNKACGGSNVYIENRATSALYRYTPYQPNAGALAAGWGQAYCGAYGNRNFYLYFKKWFGDPTISNYETFPRKEKSDEQTIPNGDYRLSTLLNSSQYLDVAGANTADGAKVQLYRQWSKINKAQMWRLTHLGDNFYSITSLLSDKNLSYNKKNIQNGEPTILLPKNTNDCSQRWRSIKSNDGFIFASSCDERQRLDVQQARAQDNNPVQIWQYWQDDNKAQIWKLSNTF